MELYQTKTNPRVYLPYVANALHNLDASQYIQNQIQAALANLSESLSINRKLAKINPNVYLPDVAMLLQHLGLFHYQQNNHSQSLEKLNQAKAIYQQLIKQAIDDNTIN